MVWLVAVVALVVANSGPIVAIVIAVALAVTAMDLLAQYILSTGKRYLRGTFKENSTP